MDTITERIPPDDGDEAYCLSDGNSPLDHRPRDAHSVDGNPVYWRFSVSKPIRPATR